MFDNDWKLDPNSKTFDALDLELFKNYKFKTILSYVFLLWGLTILKVVLFASDIYTSIKLLAFNSWSNNVIKPYLSFRISKWLFSGCILASIVLMIWEVINGIRIYKTKSIALTYINNFSRMVYSIKDYNIFCVYHKITPKGRMQKMAFFTFFEFKDCARLLFTDTPRQVINGLTLWSVLVTKNNGANLGKLENFDGLISKIKFIADTNREEAVLLSFMLVSFAIWAFFMAKLVIAAVLAQFVYHYIYAHPSVKGLKEFVCTTVNKRVDQLVEKYKWKKDQKQALETGLLNSTFTLPTLDELEKQSPESSSEFLYKLTPRGTATSINVQHPPSFDKPKRKFVPVPFTSVINEDAARSIDSLPPRTVFPPYPHADLEVRPKPSYESLSAPKVNPFRSKPFNETSESLSSAPQRQLLGERTETFVSERVFVKQLIPRDTSNSEMTSNQALDIIDDYNTSQDDVATPLMPSNTFNSSNSHITTPDRAYFNNNSNTTGLPERSTSILNRTLRMEQQDYDVYVDRFNKK